MQANRRARLASLIREELSVVVPREVKDPRIPMVTITNVDVTEDGGAAKVYVTILGNALSNGGSTDGISSREMKECLEGLKSATGYLRRHLARVLTLRTVPELQFLEDRGLHNTLRVHELLKQISAEPVLEPVSDPVLAQGSGNGSGLADVDGATSSAKSSDPPSPDIDSNSENE